MKKSLIVLVVVGVLVLGVAYKGRHRIESMFLGTPAPTQTTTTDMMSTYPTASPTPSPMTQSSTVMTETDPSKGNYLADANGMTLYTYDKDKKNVSNCTGACLTTWPPYLAGSPAPSLAANLTIFKRANGSMQYAYKGMPLYYYAKDKNPGDINGDGVGGVWHLVKP